MFVMLQVHVSICPPTTPHWWQEPGTLTGSNLLWLDSTQDSQVHTGSVSGSLAHHRHCRSLEQVSYKKRKTLSWQVTMTFLLQVSWQVTVTFLLQISYFAVYIFILILMISVCFFNSITDLSDSVTVCVIVCDVFHWSNDTNIGDMKHGSTSWFVATIHV